MPVNNVGIDQGPIGSPAVPSSTTPFTNPYAFACLVTVKGIITAIAVDGITIGMTVGMAIVPKGSTITLTYISAPTWSWYGLT